MTHDYNRSFQTCSGVYNLLSILVKSACTYALVNWDGATWAAALYPVNGGCFRIGYLDHGWPKRKNHAAEITTTTKGDITMQGGRLSFPILMDGVR